MFTTPEDAEHAFYDAMRQGDHAMMMEVWADDDDIVCVHPGITRAMGHDAVSQAWKQLLANPAKTVWPVQTKAVNAVMCALHVLIEQISDETPTGVVKRCLYSTLVFQKSAGGWKAILYHASYAPDEAALLDQTNCHDILH
jgi:ketosteroid isomerase-like protein